MKTIKKSPSGGAKTYVFGSFSVQHDRERQTKKLSVNGRRLLIVGVIALLSLYAGIVASGYTWLRHFRKLEEISIVDVALFRWKQVRRNIATQQFEKGTSEWRAGKYQSAYLAFSSALRNDSTNVEGTLQAAEFLNSVGATNLAVNVLKDAVQRLPQNALLIEKTFDLLLATSRDKEALGLLRGPLSGAAAGPNSSQLHGYEVMAILGVEGPTAARTTLEKYPDVRDRPASAPIVARILWESKERLAAINILDRYVKSRPQTFAAYALLAQYQEISGLDGDAHRTALLASEVFPHEIPSRILRIATDPSSTADEVANWHADIAGYLTDFKDQPQFLELLADLAGRKGWIDLSKALYEVGVERQHDVRQLALSYSDALLRNGRIKEAAQVLADVDLQTQESGAGSVSLRQRQVEVSAAMGNMEGVRDNAKRLANSLRQDPDKLEAMRRRFERLGIKEAVAEMEPAASGVRLAAKK